jgi:NTP pyrophosphatase (non-canonical NTP hydrolase)
MSNTEPLSLDSFQRQQKAWSEHNFPGQENWVPLLGVVEEVGELAHAHIKAHQGIRTDQDHEAKGKDAVGDIMVYLAHYCTDRGWSLQECMEQTWARVAKRDWRADPASGGEAKN